MSDAIEVSVNAEEYTFTVKVNGVQTAEGPLEYIDGIRLADINTPNRTTLTVKLVAW